MPHFLEGISRYIKSSSITSVIPARFVEQVKVLDRECSAVNNIIAHAGAPTPKHRHAFSVFEMYHVRSWCFAYHGSDVAHGPIFCAALVGTNVLLVVTQEETAQAFAGLFQRARQLFDGIQHKVADLQYYTHGCRGEAPTLLSVFALAFCFVRFLGLPHLGRARHKRGSTQVLASFFKPFPSVKPSADQERSGHSMIMANL